MNKELLPEELKAKEFIMEKFVPVLHDVLSSGNPIEYIRWSGNACRQAAVFGVHFLKELLPNYKWYAWDGDFEDIIVKDGISHNVEYNHAWIYGVDYKNKRNLLVDPSRKEREQLFIIVEENEYPLDHPDYIHMKKIRSHKVDLKARMKEREYYTSLKSRRVLEMLEERLK